jgi:hypothetical protein
MSRQDLPLLEQLTNPSVGETKLVVEDSGVEQTLNMPRLVTLLAQQALGTRGYSGSRGTVGYTGSVGVASTAVPENYNSTGIPGQVSWDGTYFYYCVGNDLWIRIVGAETSW